MNGASNKCWRFVLRGVAFAVSLSLLSCHHDPSEVRWEYTIPDGYQGYLAVRFECPGGEPLIRNGVAGVRFRADGTFCTSDSYMPTWSTQWFPKLTGSAHRNSSGKPIDQIDQPAESGYAICCVGVTDYGKYRLLTMWVGDMKSRDTIISVTL
jgi:hypothetical protein